MADYNLSTGGIPSATGIPQVYETCKNDFVVVLRQCFSSNLTDENLRFDADKSKTKIAIYKGYPEVIEFYPSIFVAVDSIGLDFKFVSDDYTGGKADGTEDYFTMPVSFNVNLSVFSRSQLERERIVDHLIFYLRHLFLGEFRRKYFFYSKNLSGSNETMADGNGVPIYSIRFVIPCYSEYFSKVTYNEVNRLTGVNVSFSGT